MRVFSVALALAVSSTPLWSDVVKLNNGTRIEGEVRRIEGGLIVTTKDGKQTQLKSTDVAGIEQSNKADIQTASTFASLKRAAENLNDPREAIDRYQRFIDMNKTSPLVEDAKKEIAVWQDRIDRGFIKWNGQWIAQQDVSSKIKGAIDKASEARILLKQGRLKDADVLITDALKIDPANISALYLKGVLAYRQEQLGVAKKNFETVAGLIKDHAPTLNNLAVILWRQKRYPEALNYYDQAMLASPKNRDILNNVAEALNELPDNQRSGQVVQKATRHFNEQDNALQTEMAQYGWYRWGATWVNQKELDRLRQQDKEVQEKKDALSGEFEATKARITSIDQSVDDTERSIRRVEATSYSRDINGNLVRVAYPPIYYELQDDINKLRSQRAAELVKLDQIRDSAEQLQQRMAAPRFTKLQRIIDIEGTPVVMLPEMPTTQPSVSLTTQPSTQPTTQPIVK